MRYLLLPFALAGILVAPAIAHAPPRPVEKRCGWLINPTPANWWLRDRAGEWTLGEQGGYQAPGLDDLPDMSARGWIKTNGSYGYGCACLDVVTDRESKRVLRVAGGRPLPIAQCRADRRLGKP